MAALEIIALDTATPQLRAPGAGDTYSAPRAVDISPETLTGSSAVSSLSIAQTWNTTGTPSALLIDVTNTASGANSYLINARLGGTSIFRVRRDGYVQTALNGGLAAISGSVINFYDSAGNDMAQMNGSNPFQCRGIAIGTSPANSNGDTILARDAADTLALRRTTNAQTFRVYNTFTDASNYERGFTRWSGNIFEIGTEAAGTGTNRDIRLITGAFTHTFSATDGSLLLSGAARLLSANARVELGEVTAPSAPSANRVVIYAEDNGGGKTRLMARFATGAAQQIAIEP